VTQRAPIRVIPGGVRIDLRVIPRSPRTFVGGERNGRLLVRVTAPPVDQAANSAVEAAIAEALGIPARRVRLVSGQASRSKTVEVTGVTEAQALGLIQTSAG
jgi:uncharacterized protein YggU (UPF0235/DUF167 family)